MKAMCSALDISIAGSGGGMVAVGNLGSISHQWER